MIVISSTCSPRFWYQSETQNPLWPYCFQVRFDAIQGTPIVLDDDFLAALPLSIREGLKAINLRGPVWAGTALIVDVGAEVDQYPLVWWDGGAFLRKQAFHAGLARKAEQRAGGFQDRRAARLDARRH